MPPEYPKQDSESKSNSKSFTLGSGIPTVHSLSSTYLESNGWSKFDKLKWVKNKHSIKYTGYNWILDDKTTIQFVEELNEEIKTGKPPEQ